MDPASEPRASRRASRAALAAESGDPQFVAAMRSIPDEDVHDLADRLGVMDVCVEKATALRDMIAQLTWANPVCGHCKASPARQGPKMKRCSGCQLEFYCSRECQVADWPQHKAACRARLA